MESNEYCWLCCRKITSKYYSRNLVLSGHKHKICDDCAEKLKEKPFMRRPSYDGAIFNGEYY